MSNSAPATPDPVEEPSFFQRLALVRPAERIVVLLASLYFFFVLASYFVLRAMREQVGIQDDITNLAWLFTGTFIAMAFANPIYGALISRFPRRTFIPIVYRFFALNLIAFYLAFQFGSSELIASVNKTFYIWTSVFNLFVVTVFRGFMADVFSEEQGKRLFPLIGVGGTLGAIAGSAVNKNWAADIGPVNLMLLSVALLEVATQCMLALSRRTSRDAARLGRADRGTQMVGGSVLEGMAIAFRSPFMLAIVVAAFLAASSNTLFYVEQLKIVKATFADKTAQRAAFGTIDFWVQTLTLFLELFVTGRLLRRIGMRFALLGLPLVYVTAFFVLRAWPEFAVLACCQVALRATGYGFNSPSFEVIYTKLPREVKYRTKSLIDTFVQRTGDLGGVWLQASLVGTTVVIAYIGAPLALAWAVLAGWIGNRHERGGGADS